MAFEKLKLFILKCKIGYTKEKWEIGGCGTNNCSQCLAGKVDFCDRYKFACDSFHVCNHFVPRPLSKREKAEFDRASKEIFDAFESLVKNIPNYGKSVFSDLHKGCPG